MSTVVNKITFQIIESANTPDFSPSEWLINPIMPSFDQKFWKIENNEIVEMSEQEKQQILDEDAKLKEFHDLKSRMEWGNRVIENFRLYSCYVEMNLLFLQTVGQIVMTLQLGMLNDSAAQIQYSEETDILDSVYVPKIYDGNLTIVPNETVRERFIRMILTEGPTP
jgi:hypothetical protein